MHTSFPVSDEMHAAGLSMPAQPPWRISWNALQSLTAAHKCQLQDVCTGPIITVLRCSCAALQPMWETFGHVHAASAEVGRTTAALLAGDDRGHVPAQLEEADDAMRELIRARCKLQPTH